MSEKQLQAPRLVPMASTFIFSYALGALLLGVLIWISGVWDFLANTRLLDPLIKGGIVSLRDDQPGFIAGVPDLKYFLKSQDPIDWALVFFASGIFCLFFAVKAIQYHGFAKFVGQPGQFGEHTRAYLYGQSMTRLLPFNAGNVAMASAFTTSGGTIERASLIVFLGEISIVFEILVFALGGLYDIGWGLWLAQLFWPIVIALATWLFVRRSKSFPRGGVLHGSWQDWKDALATVWRRPKALGKFALLGLIAFALEDIAAYMIAMAFTGDRVIIDVSFGVLLMGVVGSYIARLIPVTPGGIGQFEWGFALALYWGGLGLPECVALAVLDNALRYVTGTALAGGVALRYGLQTRWSEVRQRFARTEVESGA